MSKWADYCISHVRYNSAGTHIDQVTVRTDIDDKLTDSIILSRTEVLNALKSGSTFITVYKEDNMWQKGAFVKLIKVDGTYYIKTVLNKLKKDNLGKLTVLSNVGRLHGK